MEIHHPPPRSSFIAGIVVCVLLVNITSLLAFFLPPHHILLGPDFCFHFLLLPTNLHANKHFTINILKKATSCVRFLSSIPCTQDRLQAVGSKPTVYNLEREHLPTVYDTR